MSVGELRIHIDHERIACFCQARGIRRLSLFGSVLHDNLDPQCSDVDVFAEFEPGVLKNVGFQYFGYGEELAAVIGRKVDFCSRLHPLIFDRVKDELFPVYERPGRRFDTEADHRGLRQSHRTEELRDLGRSKLKESVNAILAREFPKASPR